MIKGFSLLELSIVLVIIGLIAGGIVAGSSMIRAAELRAVITEQQQFKTAIYTFRDKYLGLPGDLKNAEAFWGTVDADDATCKTTIGTGTQTCSGDGDGSVSKHNVRSHEYFRLWQHLANAELISGTFTGVTGSGGTDDVEYSGDINSPSSKLSGAGWMIGAGLSGSTQTYDIEYGHYFGIGAESATGGAIDASFSAEEVWNLDKKIDDGIPSRGSVIARYWDDACAKAVDGTHANDDLDAVYKLEDDSIQCSIYFIKQF